MAPEVIYSVRGSEASLGFPTTSPTMCYYIKKCEKVIMGYGSQCLQTQPAEEEVTGSLCSSWPLEGCPGAGLRGGQCVQEPREEPAAVSQKHPCLGMYSKLVSTPRSPRSVRPSSPVEKLLMAPSLGSSVGFLLISMARD